MKFYQLLYHDQWFSLGTPASSTTKIGRHDIAELLLKVALNTINQIINHCNICRSEIQITSTSFNLFQFENSAFSKINKLVLLICISEQQIERRGSGTSSAGYE